MMPVALGSNCGLSLLKMRSRFQITALALKSVPSWNLTPFLRWKIQVFLSSGDCSQVSAKPGRRVASWSVFVRSNRIMPSKIGKPRKRMPSKPLFGMPVVVGMSDAVMAMRSTFSCADAGDRESSEAAHAEARRRKRRVIMASPSVGPRVTTVASPAHASSGPERTPAGSLGLDVDCPYGRQLELFRDDIPRARWIGYVSLDVPLVRAPGSPACLIPWSPVVRA